MKKHNIYEVSFWGVRCWYNEHDNSLLGINWLYDLLIIPAACFQNFMAMITGFLFPTWDNPGFRLKVIKKNTPNGRI